MTFKKILFLSSILLISPVAQAIPPPDALISVWQSTLQLLGVISVFLVGFYYSLRQYLSAWKKPILAMLVMTIMGSAIYLFLPKQTAKATPPSRASHSDIPSLSHDKSAIKNTLIQGELLPIKAVIAREPDKFTRTWKLDTYEEMRQEMLAIRSKKHLPAFRLLDITSFTPQALNKHIQSSPEKLFLLDVRGAYERKHFSIPHQASVHYGDLIHSTLPEKLKQQLPKDKLIVVLCHSGLRGYIAANLLHQLGYNNVAFLQGGLAAWSKQKLPLNGREDYSSATSIYPIMGDKQVYKDNNLLKVEIDVEDDVIKNIPNLIHLPFEIATSKDINNIIQQSKTKPIVIICKTYGGCFHIANFGYLIEQAGGKVAGVFDETGQFVIPPIIE